MNNKKGFTLAELLIVIAIIAVLVGIMFPVFSGSTEKAKDAVSLANLRSAYGEACTAYLTGEGSENVVISFNFVTVKNVEFKGNKKDSFSGNAASLPFEIMTYEDDVEPDAGIHEVYFAFDSDFTAESDGNVVAYIY